MTTNIYLARLLAQERERELLRDHGHRSYGTSTKRPRTHWLRRLLRTTTRARKVSAGHTWTAA
jgi:hypothetical protein